MTIKAVFFDMGGTIQNYWRMPDLGLQAVPDIQKHLLDAGITLNLDDQQLHQLILDGLKHYHDWSLQSLTELPPYQIWGEYILTDYPVSSEQLETVADQLMVIIETHFFHREMRPEIPAVLTQIKQMGLKIGMISNVNNFGQVPQNLSEYGIKDYFNPIVLSSSYGYRKPNPAIFHQAARLAKVPTSACLHVGDRLSRDILGAKRAGFHTAVQILHAYAEGEDQAEVVPDFVIETMTELVDIIQRIQTKTTGKNSFNVSRPDKIRAILFDAGDVLYFRSNRGVKFSSFLEAQENHIVDQFPKQKIADLKLKAYRGQIPFKTYLEEYLRLFGITQPESIERGIQILIEEKNDVKFFDGVRSTLKTLKEQGFLLGIITDTANTVDAKLSWFECGGIGNLWDSITSSRDIGARKPEPKIYHAALEQLGLRAEQAVFIGHKAAELEGARAVGIRTIAFNYEEDAKADFYIKSFLDLLNVPIISP